jgi:Rubrerythrin
MAQFINPFPGLLEDKTLDEISLVQALRQAHAAEGEAVHLYETLAQHTDNQLVVKVLKDIAREEQVHLGEIQQLIDQLDKNEVAAQSEGRQEVKESGEKSATAQLGWRKAPSVTQGGKPYFWYIDTPGGRLWVVWNRAYGKWVVHDEQNKILAQFDSDKEGKNFVQQMGERQALKKYFAILCKGNC